MQQSKRSKKAQNSSIIAAVVSMMIFTAASNYLVEIPISDWLTWGSFTYPLTFLVTELTNYYHGPKIARRVVYIGFTVAVTLSFMWMNRRIALASSCAFLFGQLLDISVFTHLRRKRWWIAPAAASVSASAIDTALFFSLAFAGQNVPWVTLAIGDFGVKLAMDLGMLLPFRWILWNRLQRSFV